MLLLSTRWIDFCQIYGRKSSMDFHDTRGLDTSICLTSHVQLHIEVLVMWRSYSDGLDVGC